jgi:hypothetical protein
MTAQIRFGGCHPARQVSDDVFRASRFRGARPIGQPLPDNDAEILEPHSVLALRLRRRGISVLIVHHTGKDGAQRGTSRREDVLDTSLSLRRRSDYDPTQGARIEVHIEKRRGLHGDAAKPFEAQLEVRDGACFWTLREITDENGARIAALLPARF